MKRYAAILVVVLSACSRKEAPPPAGQAIACYVASQQRCKEHPAPTPDQLTNLPVECSSVSGVLSKPASCPTGGFLGKCTMGAEIKRVYKGADAAYEKDFCENTAHGAWSTTF